MTEIDRIIRRREHERARTEQVRQGAGIVLRVGRDFRDRDVPGGADEIAELAVGDRRPVDPEPVDGDAVDRSLLGIVPVRSHPEGAAHEPDHVRI